MSSINSNYPFLELISETDAAARGANINERVAHALFRLIRMLSTMEAAGYGALFHIGVPVPDVVNLAERDLIGVLRRLIQERIIAQLFYLDFSDEEGLQFRPVYIALPQDERITPSRLYQEVINRSVQALDVYLSKWNTHSEDAILKDLEADFRWMIKKGGSAPNFPSTIINPFTVLHAGSFPILPHPEMIRSSVQLIKEELIRRKKMLEIPDYGFMPLHQSEVKMRYEIACDFFNTRIIDKYRKVGNCRKEIEQIALEEARYYIDEAATNTEFTVKRATSIKKGILAGNSGVDRIGIRYPGSLAVEMILHLAPSTQIIYNEEWNAKLNEQFQEFKKDILDADATGAGVLYIDEKEAMDHHPDVWDRLINDRDMLHDTWEQKGSTIHLFVNHDNESVRAVVRSMLRLSENHYWKIFSLKILIDRNEEQLPGLFTDTEFVRIYGRILRKAYISLVPWYHKILFLFGITLFQDSAFHIAKKRIAFEQSILAEQNRERYRKLKDRKNEVKQEKFARIDDLTFINRIIEKLDQFYLVDGKIPTVADIKNLLPEISTDTFKSLVKQANFQLVSSGIGEPFEAGVLLYPPNYEWQAKSARLRKQLEKMEQRVTERGMMNDPEKRLLEQIRRIKKLLSRKGEEQDKSLLASNDEDDDPYKLLEREIQKQKNREADGEEDLAELEI